MKKNRLRVFVETCALLVVLAMTDLFVGYAANKYTKWLNLYPRNGDAALINYNLNAATPDIAIIGSSTAICHYDPKIIHDSLLVYLGKDLNVFNMGMSRQRMAYCYYVQKSLLNRKTPKVVIVDVWASYLSDNFESCQFSEFRPYIKSNPAVKEMFEKYDQLNVSTCSNMYCYNTELVKLLMSATKAGCANGFDGSSKTELVVPATKEIEEDKTGLSKRSVEDFDRMVELSLKNKYKLIIVLSPRLNPSDTTSLSYKYMKDKCVDNSIPFLDYANDVRYYNTHFFRDKTHMNYYGAEQFTKDLMKDIKKVLD